MHVVTGQNKLAKVTRGGLTHKIRFEQKEALAAN